MPLNITISEKMKPSILINSEIKEQEILIRVEDNGRGIPKEYHDRIFDMFYRASEQSEGSGLGLYIAKEMAIKLSGDLKLETDTSEGAKFLITLPLKATA